MEFINAADRMPTDPHREYWCRVKMKPLIKRKKSEIPYRAFIGGHELTPKEIKRLNSEVFCVSLAIHVQKESYYLNDTLISSGYYFVSPNFNYTNLAESIEWLDGDGSTPTEELFHPPHSYQMEKLREMKEQLAQH